MLDSNGLINQNTTVDQLIKAVNNGDISKTNLDEIYVSVSDKYWTKLSDLVGNATTKVQVGEEIKKVVDVEGHYEDVVKEVVENIPGHWEEVTKTIAKETVKTGKRMEDNEMIKSILKAVGKIGSGIIAADTADIVYENVRKTKTQKSKGKREYDFDDGTAEGFEYTKSKKNKKSHDDEER